MEPGWSRGQTASPSLVLFNPCFSAIAGFTRPAVTMARFRVTRACDRCKKRKIRCNGLQACETCVDRNHSCTYTAPYCRGRLPPRIQDHQENRPPCPASVELAPTDLDGHYFGPASEPAFLLQVQRSLNPSPSVSRVLLTFSSSDDPLPSLEPALEDAMTPEKTAQMVQLFFDCAMPVGQFVHRPTVESWVANPSSDSQLRSHPRRALLHSMFAIVEQHMNPGDTSASRGHFAAAQLQHQIPITLINIQAHLCQCIWLLRESQISQSWELLGVVARHALAIGLHRASYLRDASHYHPVSAESCRRTFWCLYSLDNCLSIALGRPKTLNDLDIDQELPRLEEELGDVENQPSLSLEDGNAALLATVAYFRLGRIISKVLRDFYSCSPRSVTEQMALVTEHLQSLQDWREEFCKVSIPQHSDPGASDRTTLLLRDFLDLVSSHATILITRPLLLESLASSHAASRTHTHTVDKKRDLEFRVGQCEAAALNITDILSDIDYAKRMARAFWFTPFIALSPITVLYSCSCRGLALAQPVTNHLPAASRCQTVLLNIVREDSLAAKYALLVEDIRPRV
ncbi:hypothetical protein ASPVEDRAFT_154625 [Aspergillus versicolor CBS 583.65]|uniref:Zn(2)-C6 fungal-type domain-containing protein n=1 Tax=Aspergillus versicolor CBS 583.65 TaxID=1036611 RepID=A0A1L9PYW0_ASPVE|nr:uncharacterized protein ASPVEDRAFT_154625 [Aspergillus versicolor CBS 583.65]OJJ06632.1 hypothetical protein ASPVEDRAFT_154625 [Aspergillus versicolor CBS 583.65]